DGKADHRRVRQERAPEKNRRRRNREEKRRAAPDRAIPATPSESVEADDRRQRERDGYRPADHVADAEPAKKQRARPLEERKLHPDIRFAGAAPADAALTGVGR